MKNIVIYTQLVLLLIISSCNISSSKDIKIKSSVEDSFDPFGYYYPIDTLQIKDYVVDQLSILTKISDSNDESTDIDMIFIQLYKFDSDSIKRIVFDSFKLENKVLVLFVKDEEFGEVSFKGHFTGEKGPIRDKLEVNAVVLEGTLKINSDLTQEIEFTWFGGD